MIIRLLLRVLVALFILFVGLILVKVVLESAGNGSKGEEVKKQEERLGVALNWKIFHSIIGNFKMAVPGEFHHESEEIPLTDIEAVTKYDTYITENIDDVTYMVTVVRYPPEVRIMNSEEMLEKVMNEIINADQDNELKAYYMVTFDDMHPALDFIIQNKKMQTEYRGMLALHTLYLLSVSSDMPKLKQGEFTNFIDSFRFID